jgi:hypothetical protein
LVAFSGIKMTYATTIAICFMWLAVIVGMYIVGHVGFWIFAQLFGVIDRFIQR